MHQRAAWQTRAAARSSMQCSWYSASGWSWSRATGPARRGRGRRRRAGKSNSNQATALGRVEAPRSRTWLRAHAEAGQARAAAPCGSAAIASAASSASIRKAHRRSRVGPCTEHGVARSIVQSRRSRLQSGFHVTGHRISVSSSWKLLDRSAIWAGLSLRNTSNGRAAARCRCARIQRSNFGPFPENV